MSATRRALHPAHPSLLRALLAPALLAVALLSQLVLAPGASATGRPAAPRAVLPARAVALAHARTVAAPLGVRAVAVAATRRGDRYRLGAAGPTRFDCSGLTSWTYGRLGRRLPHNAQAQWRVTRHVHRGDRRPGDLVFFFAHHRAFHVGVYAGRGRIWHAPKPGDHVRLSRLWTSRVGYGRVR